MGSWAQSRFLSTHFQLDNRHLRGTIENSMAGLRTYSDSIHKPANPASYSKLQLTTYAMGLTHTETFASSDSGNEEYDATSVQYISIGIPVGPTTGSKAEDRFGLIPFSL
jgi:hypothetical protein